MKPGAMKRRRQEAIGVGIGIGIEFASPPDRGRGDDARSAWPCGLRATVRPAGSTPIPTPTPMAGDERQ